MLYCVILSDFSVALTSPTRGNVLNCACITQLPKPVIPPPTGWGNGICAELTSFGCGVRYNLKHVPLPTSMHHQSKYAENGHDGRLENNKFHQQGTAKTISYFNCNSLCDSVSSILFTIHNLHMKISHDTDINFNYSAHGSQGGAFVHSQHQLHPFTNYNWESEPFTLRAINNVCAKCINSFPSVEETISLRGNKEGKPEVGVETKGRLDRAGSISLMGNEGH